MEVGLPEFMPMMVDEYNNLSPEIFRPNMIEIFDLRDFFSRA